jgi:hypothetical protein
MQGSRIGKGDIHQSGCAPLVPKIATAIPRRKQNARLGLSTPAQLPQGCAEKWVRIVGLLRVGGINEDGRTELFSRRAAGEENFVGGELETDAAMWHCQVVDLAVQACHR